MLLIHSGNYNSFIPRRKKPLLDHVETMVKFKVPTHQPCLSYDSGHVYRDNIQNFDCNRTLAPIPTGVIAEGGASEEQRQRVMQEGRVAPG